MPELPEVETIRLQLNTVLPGLIIQKLQVLNPKSFIGDKKLVIGEKIIGVRRFAKLLIIDFSNGLSLAVHLKMTGQLVYQGDREGLTRIIIEFTNRSRLFFNDLRKFGWMRVVNDDHKSDLIKNLGPEPLKDLTIIKFKEILKLSNKPVKLVLMDQEKIAGVGNIYANEALFLAGIDPGKKAKELNDGSIVPLFHCLEKVLKEGIKLGGASSNNYVNAFGEKGKAQEHFLVYGKNGQNCPNKCGSEIIRIKLGGRGTFYCPKCQKVK